MYFVFLCNCRNNKSFTDTKFKKKKFKKKQVDFISVHDPSLVECRVRTKIRTYGQKRRKSWFYRCAFISDTRARISGRRDVLCVFRSTRARSNTTWRKTKIHVTVLLGSGSNKRLSRTFKNTIVYNLSFPLILTYVLETDGFARIISKCRDAPVGLGLLYGGARQPFTE